MLTPEKYEEKRDELVALLNETTTMIDEVVADNRDLGLDEVVKDNIEIKEIARRLKEDQFRLVLVGRFQSGKSTSFNAMANGLLLSPMGNGSTSTSASVYTVNNVTAPSDEGVVITWRTDEQLNGVCSTLPALCDDDFDIANPKSREATKRKHAELLAIWKENKQAQAGIRDSLLTTGLILHFYGNPHLESLKNKTSFDIGEVGSMLCFPDDYITRYENGDPTEFEAKEVVFPFIGHAACRTQSANLEQIGAVVVDCPGLFASTYDTLVAESQISAADAVWLLVNGGSQLGDTDLNAIARCRELAGDAVFISANMLSAAIIPTKENFIKMREKTLLTQFTWMKLVTKAEDIHLYHALLAFLAEYGPRLVARDGTREGDFFLVKLANEKDLKFGEVFTDPREAWEALAEDLLQTLKVPACLRFKSLSPKLSAEGIQIVRDVSGLDEIVSAMKQYIVENKGRITLVDKGAGKAKIILSGEESKPGEPSKRGIETCLRRKELDAQLDEKSAEQAYAIAEGLLNEFVEAAEGQLKPLEGDNGTVIDRTIAGDFFDYLTKDENLREIAEESAQKIHAQSDFWNRVIPSKSAALYNKVVSGELKQRVELLHKAWYTAAVKGENKVVKTSLAEPVYQAQRFMKLRWERLAGENPESIFAGLALPVAQKKPVSIAAMLEDMPKELAMASAKKAFKGVGAASLVALGVAGVLTFVTWPVAIPAGMIAVLFRGGGAFTQLINMLKDAFSGPDVGEIAGKLKDQLKRSLGAQRTEIINSLSKDDSLRNYYVEAINSMLGAAQATLKEEKAAALKVAQNKKSERIKIAKRSAEIRSDKVQPMRQRFERFVQEVEQACMS